jgi:hypothetical protein
MMERERTRFKDQLPEGECLACVRGYEQRTATACRLCDGGIAAAALDQHLASGITHLRLRRCVCGIHLRHPAPASSMNMPSDKELVIEACRSNNTELLREVLARHERPAELLNSARTAVGSYAYHEAAGRGSCECAERERQRLTGRGRDRAAAGAGGLRVRSGKRRGRDAAAQRGAVDQRAAARAVGGGGGPGAGDVRGRQRTEVSGVVLAAILTSRARNEGRLTPAELVDARNAALRAQLDDAEYVAANRGDFVEGD